jgi:hypothetical protein
MKEKVHEIWKEAIRLLNENPNNKELRKIAMGLAILLDKEFSHQVLQRGCGK